MADFPYKDPDEVRYEKPALFVRGTKSHYVADDTLPVVGRFFPSFELRDVDAGHWVMSEKPAAFKEGKWSIQHQSSLTLFTYFDNPLCCGSKANRFLVAVVEFLQRHD